MGMPSNVKTWRHVVNQRAVASGTVAIDYRNALYAMISGLAPSGTPAGCWIHMQSCDSSTISTTEGNDNTKITAPAKLIWNTSANGTQVRSWVVLKQPGISTNFAILIECHAGTSSVTAFERYIRIFACAAGYNTDGTTTTRPTAAGTEVTLKDGSTAVTLPSGYLISGLAAYNATFAPVVHVMHSTDGECTRVVFCAGGKSRALYLFDKQCNPPAGLSPTYILGASVQTTDVSTLTLAEWNTLAKLRGLSSTLVYDCFASSEGWNALMMPAALNVVANELSGEWPLCPIGIVCTATTGARGRHGTLFDLWWGTSNQADGTTYPAGGTKTHVQFGHMVFPWNGSTPLLT